MRCFPAPFFGLGFLSAAILSMSVPLVAGCAHTGGMVAYSDPYLSARLPDTWDPGPPDPKGGGIMFAPKGWDWQQGHAPIGIVSEPIPHGTAVKVFADRWLRNSSSQRLGAMTHETLTIGGKDIECLRFATKLYGPTVLRLAAVRGKDRVYLVIVDERTTAPTSEMAAILDSLTFSQ
jgi:hypothetical protein